jgi:hypothetical protein
MEEHIYFDSLCTYFYYIYAISAKFHCPRIRDRIVISNICFSGLGQKYMVTSHAVNSDSSGDQSQTSTFTYPSMDSTKARGNASSFASTAGSGDSTDIKPQRPNFLDLCTSRKQKFTFSVTATGDEGGDSVAGTSESDELATNTTLGSASQYCLTTSNSSEDFRTDCVDSSDANYDGSLPTEPASMPPLTNLSSTSSTSTAFSYRNPAYQSAHPVCYTSNSQASMRKNSQDGAGHASDQDIPGKLFKCQAGPGDEGSRGLLKWKGIVFTPEHDDVDEVRSDNMTDDSSSQLTIDRENEQEDQVTRRFFPVTTSTISISLYPIHHFKLENLFSQLSAPSCGPVFRQDLLT